ncbi:Uncharacterised protein [Ectopseudomonas mendocina]|uniref:Uncharacterized protein n=1 Tax=Ectopseudomonas mendocina TaxID=300 RepID=A0A379PNB3_ECTME|nr:hypothetical protein [Pseudomonas mendocina]SUE95856.1 Uncharacterised protein [Pseudomonas mendocina]
MVSFGGYIDQSTFDFFVSLKSKISSSKVDRKGRDSLFELISDLSKHGFIREYASNLLIAYEEIGTSVSELPLEDARQLLEILDRAKEGYDEVYSWVIKNAMKLTSGDSVEINQVWIDDHDEEVSEATVRKLAKDKLLQDYRGKCLSIVDHPEGPEIGLSLIGRPTMDESTGKMVRNMVTYLFARDMATSKMVRGINVKRVDHVVNFVQSTEALLEALMTGAAVCRANGIEIFDGMESAEEPAREAGHSEIRVTEEAKYPIGLFG